MNKNVIAIQVDRLSQLKPESDSSLFIAAEFCKKGFSTFFYHPLDLTITQYGTYSASGEFIEVSYRNQRSEFISLKEDNIDLATVKAVMIRQDPPFDMNYITSTYKLENLANKGVGIFNDPKAIRSHSEKMTVFKFSEFIPPSIVVASYNKHVIDFINQYDSLVVKPLYWFGGRFIEKIDNRSQAKEIIEKALVLHQYILIQKFLPEIYDGDKRVTIIDGRVAAVMRRKPAEGSFISNLAAGGTAHTAELTSRELHIAETLALYLKQQGIIFAGVDMIGEHLIEINVTSPTGLIAIEKLYGLNLAEDIVSAIYTRFI